MNCDEVSHRLTDYLDKSLDTAATTRIATHIISCALCRTESKDMADCIDQVAALPAIDPPLGFAQRVMAHIHDSEPRASLWQRLILPLLNGVPLRATTLAIVAIFAVTLYQKQQPATQESAVNLALRSDAQSPMADKPPFTAKDREIAARKEITVTAPTATAKTSMVAPSLRASALPEQSDQLQPAAPASVKSEISDALEEKNVAPKRPPLRVQEVTTARDNAPIFGDSRGFSSPLAAPRATPMAMERPTPLGDRVTDFEFIVRRRSPQRRDTIENLSSAETEVTPISTPRPSSTPATGRARIESIAEIRFYNVAPEHFETFKKELAAESNIESEPKVATKEVEAAKQADRQLLIKVTILPADQTAPSR